METGRYTHRAFFSLILLVVMVFFVACGAADSTDSTDSDDTDTNESSDSTNSDDITWTFIWRDMFDRNDTFFDGQEDSTELGSDWKAFADTSTDPNSMIQITDQRVEARGNSGADWRVQLNGSMLKLAIDLTTANVGNLDTSGGDFSNSFAFYDEQYNTDEGGCPYTAGIVLQENVYKAFLIKQISTSPGYESMAAETITLEPDTTYGMQFIVANGNLSFKLSNDSGDILSEITASGASCTFVQPGFSMQYTDDVSFYFDNFEAYVGTVAD